MFLCPPGPRQDDPLPANGRRDVHQREARFLHVQAVSAGGVRLQQGARHPHQIRQTDGGETAGQHGLHPLTLDHYLTTSAAPASGLLSKCT